MLRWSNWRIFLSTDPDSKKGVKDLPKVEYLVYEFGIARPGKTPRTTYVGHGDSRRLGIHRGGGWDRPIRFWYSSTELYPYAKAVLRRGYSIFYRYAAMRSKVSAQRIEAQRIRDWWKYPWNNKDMPWQGARLVWKRMK
jgi:hypothetical protein